MACLPSSCPYGARTALHLTSGSVTRGQTDRDVQGVNAGHLPSGFMATQPTRRGRALVAREPVLDSDGRAIPAGSGWVTLWPLGTELPSILIATSAIESG